MLDKNLEILVLSWSSSPKSRFKHNVPKRNTQKLTNICPLEIGRFSPTSFMEGFRAMFSTTQLPKKNPRTNPDPSRELRLERSQSANQAHPVCTGWSDVTTVSGPKKVVPKSRNQWSGLLERERDREKKKHFLFPQDHKSISSVGSHFIGLTCSRLIISSLLAATKAMLVVQCKIQTEIQPHIDPKELSKEIIRRFKSSQKSNWGDVRSNFIDVGFIHTPNRLCFTPFLSLEVFIIFAFCPRRGWGKSCFFSDCANGLGRHHKDAIRTEK